jgi:hypothetical protein
MSKQLTKEEIEQSLQEKTGRLPGEDTRAFILRQQNLAALASKQKRDATTQITRGEVEAKVAALDAARQLRIDQATVKAHEDAKRAAENPFSAVLSDNVTMSRATKKRFENLAAERTAENEGKQAEIERIEALQQRPEYLAAVRDSQAFLDSLSEGASKQELRNAQAVLTTTYDVEKYRETVADIVGRARASLTAALGEANLESDAAKAKADNIATQAGALDAISPE